jgi:hypothetical protein
MKTLAKIAASSVSVVVASVAWLTSHPVHARSLDDLGRKDPVSVSVCVGADSVIRIASPGGGCPPGQKALPLDLGAPGTLGPDDAPGADDDAIPKSSGTSPEQQLADLERRVAELEKTALLEVVDKDDRVIFSVAPQNVSLYNPHQALVFALRATSGAGSMTVWSSDGALETSAGVFGTQSGLWVAENGVARVNLGRRPVGNYALRIFSRGGKTLAGVGESSETSGMLVVGDDSGQLRATMDISGDRPFVTLMNGSGKGLASLAESTTGAGIFELGDQGGAPMVKMVVNDDRYGAVLAGPSAGFPLVPSSGLPGSYFLGCAGGDACRP